MKTNTSIYQAHPCVPMCEALKGHWQVQDDSYHPKELPIYPERETSAKPVIAMPLQEGAEDVAGHEGGTSTTKTPYLDAKLAVTGWIFTSN